jgi:phage terminase large subunit
MDVTIVFQKNWDAIHETTETGERRYRYIVNVGSSRSSKTISLIDIFDLYARQNPNKRLTVWRDTLKLCKDTVLNDALKRYKKTGRHGWDNSFNKQESIFTYTNGSTLEIRGTDDEEKVHGMTQDAAWLNEPYNISRETFNQLDQRTADFIVLDLNPKKNHWSDDLLKDPRTLVIHSTFRDNPFCPAESKRKILSYQPVSMCRAVEQELLTEQDAMNYDTLANEKELTPGMVKELQRCQENERKNSASAFNWCVYGLGTKAEKPNRIFRWRKIPRYQYDALDCGVIYGCDWGKVDPWGILEAKYYDGALYLRELNYLSENELRQRMDAESNARLGTDTDGLGIVVWNFNRLGIPKDRYIVCDTNRPLKIAALQRAGWEYAEAAIKPTGSIVDGISLLQDMDVFYTDDSPNIDFEQENYSYKTDRYGVLLDDPEDKDNHLTDPARYIALWLASMGLLRNKG